MRAHTHTHTHTHTHASNITFFDGSLSFSSSCTELIKEGCFAAGKEKMLHFYVLKWRKSIKNSRNINSHVHYFFSTAFSCVSGLFFSEPLEVKLCKAYLAIKHRPSLTLFFLLSAHTPLLPSFSSLGPFSASSSPLLSPPLPMSLSVRLALSAGL